MTYLETAFAMFLANPGGYLVVTGNVLIFLGVSWLVLRFLAMIFGADYKPLAIKQEWELHGRGLVVLDPNHPAYRPPDRVRLHGKLVYERFDLIRAYEAAKAHYERLHGEMDEAALSDFDFRWQFGHPDNPVLNWDYAGHPYAEKPDPDAVDVYNLLPPVKLQNKPPRR